MMSRKRILVISSQFESLKIFMGPYIRSLSLEFDVTICASSPRNKKDVEWIPSNVSVRHVLVRRKISVLTDIIALLDLTKMILLNHYDMVQTITPKASLVGQIAARLGRTKVRLHTFTGQVWATRTGWSRFFLKSFDKLVAAVTTHLLADSHSQRAFLISEGVCRPEKISVILNGSIGGVNLRRFRPDRESRIEIRDRYGLQDSDFVVLFLGRIARDKGIIDLIQAFNLISESCPALKLLVVGSDEENLISQGVISTDSFGQVIFEGNVENPETYIAAADLFCLPSYREGFGSVVIEAAACGVPAVVSDIYGLSDAIADGESGVCFSVSDVQALSHSIRRLCEDREKCRALGSRARERAIELFDADKFLIAQISFVRSILG
jgi:glycosyltransferase involved in cell wall biosynthesis